MAKNKEQEEAVERILRHDAESYYEILDVEKGASSVEIKKAYRKVSLKVHPDKNSHPRAAESFKRVARAFEVLGDENKRRMFDMGGARASSGGAGGAGGAQFNQFNPQFNQFGQFSGDDLFDILFGAGAGGGGTAFTFGGPGGVRFSTNGFGPNQFQFRHQQHPRQRQRHPQQHPQQPQTMAQTVKQLLPIILVVAIPIISNIFSSESKDSFQLSAVPPFTQERHTPTLNVPYYITSKQAREYNPKRLAKLDRDAEQFYVRDLRHKCSTEARDRERQIEDAQGWFFTDYESLEAAQGLSLPHCERLAALGLL